jgi:hypothetical protein
LFKKRITAPLDCSRRDGITEVEEGIAAGDVVSVREIGELANPAVVSCLWLSARREKPLTMEPVPAIRISARASWQTTRRLCNRREREPAEALLPASLRVSFKSSLDIRAAGARPEKMAVKSAATSAKASSPARLQTGGHVTGPG